jgi:hypothetical protein
MTVTRGDIEMGNNDKWIDELNHDELRITLRRTIDDRNHERTRAEAAEQWQVHAPWPYLRSILDAAFRFAQDNDELREECEAVEGWIDTYEIGDEPCATIHPETQQEVQA